ncbi:hypothetical protein M9H77_23074 [Catharanthus roseus]|uniref:Uncharacterized protein n=1 Tax=Catharanthus roseus TaxID=4058 RepID=A0ACC0AWA0_CATRO|nr:hypothetical protein M9H77_23074 [Catharanthus roseus]
MEFLGIGLFDRILAPDLHPDELADCTVLGLARTRASSDDVDGFLTLKVDPLKEGRSSWRAWPNRLQLPGIEVVLRFNAIDNLKFLFQIEQHHGLSIVTSLAQDQIQLAQTAFYRT